jgi:hypothetical protein
MMSQDEDEWCWAACASGMSRCGDARARPMEQCEIVAASSDERSAACEDPDGNNVQGILSDAMETVNLPCNVVPLSGFTFPVVTSSIRRNCPVGVELVDTDGLSHNVLIVGCDPQKVTVVVADPWGNPGAPAPTYRMSFNSLKNAYGGWGTALNAFVITPQ